ncbi:MAG TPA: citrate/2-methylcitrate synthase [Candidatus Aquilonibacter sp.]
MSTGMVVDRGLEGVVVGHTDLSNVEGQVGRLTYRGYDIDDLAPNASFEEVAHLLLFGHLPNATELKAFKEELASRRALPGQLLAAMQTVPKTAWPMDVMRTITSGLALFVPVNNHGEHVSDVHSAIDLIAKMATILAAWDRIRRGLQPIEPRTDLSHAANFLYMRTGKVPAEIEEDAIDTYLVLLADHSFNASTFSARVTASTRADIYASVTSALATLTGDLHGGAASATYTNLVEIGAPEKAEKFVHDEIAKGNRIMGMGHREYRVRDPRAKHLEAIAQELSKHSGTKWYPIARELENHSQRILAQEHPDRKIYANVDFYTAPVLADLGIPGDEFTALFACGRIAGWTAHILEQLHDNRLIRPQATYSGPPPGPFVPIGSR